MRSVASRDLMATNRSKYVKLSKRQDQMRPFETYLDFRIASFLR